MPVSNLADLPDLGTDGAWFGGDIDARIGLTSGLTLLGQDLVARLSTPRGGLWYDEDYGYDLSGLLNDDTSPARILEIQHNVEEEVRKDERVEDCRARVSFNAAASALHVSLHVTIAEGAFDFVLAASAVTVELLQIQETA